MEEPRKSGFLFLRPRCLADSDRIAKAIALCKGVKHVFLTSGEYGFVVALRPNLPSRLARIKKSVHRIAGRPKIASATGHYFYTSKAKRPI